MLGLAVSEESLLQLGGKKNELAWQVFWAGGRGGRGGRGPGVRGVSGWRKCSWRGTGQTDSVSKKLLVSKVKISGWCWAGGVG